MNRLGFSSGDISLIGRNLVCGRRSRTSTRRRPSTPATCRASSSGSSRRRAATGSRSRSGRNDEGRDNMNRHRLVRAPLVAGLVLALGACDQGLTEVNVNPNTPTDVGASTSFRRHRDGVAARSLRGMLSNDWAQQTAEIQYPDEDRQSAGPRMEGSGTGSTGPSAGRPDRHRQGPGGRQGQHPGRRHDLEGLALPARSPTCSVTCPTPRRCRARTTPRPPTTRIRHLRRDAPEPDGCPGDARQRGVGFGGGDILYGNDFDKWRSSPTRSACGSPCACRRSIPATAKAEFVAAYNAGGFTSNDDNAKFAWPG